MDIRTKKEKESKGAKGTYIFHMRYMRRGECDCTELMFCPEALYAVTMYLNPMKQKTQLINQK